MSTKIAAPTATSALVRRPAVRWRNWRSKPTMEPSTKALSRLTSVLASVSNWMFSKFSSCSLAAYCEQGATRPCDGRAQTCRALQTGCQLDTRASTSATSQISARASTGEQQVLVRVFHDSLLSVSAIQKTTEWRCSGGQYRDGGAGVVFPMHAAHVRALAQPQRDGVEHATQLRRAEQGDGGAGELIRFFARDAHVQRAGPAPAARSTAACAARSAWR